MGRVWRATDVVLHREVAIKELVPPPGLTPEERREMRERSLREARAIARLNNINVVRVFDVLRTDADPWIVMEYVPSRSLQDILAADGPFAPVRAAEIGLGVLNALRAAHRAGVVHRDVKPGNVLISEDGRVVLTDFGLATVPGDPNVTRTGLVLGSPAYIAPERARDGTAGPGADLWSLGATLYAAVEGASPFARPSAIATLAALATENPPPARNAGPLKPVLNGLLRKDPAHRINAEEAERLLMRATGRRSKLSFPMSPTMRRPGIGRERPSLSAPVVPGVSASAPVVPGPRPPVTPARPQSNPLGPPVTPGRSPASPPVTTGRSQPNPPVTPGRAPAIPPAGPGRTPGSPMRPPVSPGQPAAPAAAGRAPIFAPGKASVGRPPAETPTRVDGPKPPELDATRIENPNRTGTGTPSSPPPGEDASASRRPALDATMRGSGSAFGSITADEVAAHRKRPATPSGPPTTPPPTAPGARQPTTQPAKSPPPAPQASATSTVAEPHAATAPTTDAPPADHRGPAPAEDRAPAPAEHHAPAPAKDSGSASAAPAPAPAESRTPAAGRVTATSPVKRTKPTTPRQSDKTTTSEAAALGAEAAATSGAAAAPSAEMATADEAAPSAGTATAAPDAKAAAPKSKPGETAAAPEAKLADPTTEKPSTDATPADQHDAQQQSPDAATDSEPAAAKPTAAEPAEDPEPGADPAATAAATALKSPEDQPAEANKPEAGPATPEAKTEAPQTDAGTPDVESTEASIETAPSATEADKPKPEAAATPATKPATAARSTKASRKKGRRTAAAAATAASGAAAPTNEKSAAPTAAAVDTPTDGDLVTEAAAADKPAPTADPDPKAAAFEGAAAGETAAEPTPPKPDTGSTETPTGDAPPAAAAKPGAPKVPAADTDAARTRIIKPTTGAPVSGAPVSGAPGFGTPSRPAWQPMTVRAPSSGARGITVFGTTLTRRQTVIAIGVLVAVLLALVVLVPKAFGDDGGQAQDDGRKAGAGPAASAPKKPSAAPSSAPAAAAPAPTTAKPSASPTPTSKAPAAGGVPKGWYLYKGDGYSVPVPDGASVRPQGSEVYITKNNRLLIIDHSEQPKADPVADWEAQEADRRGTKYRNYDRVALKPLTFHGKAADWEFTYTTSSGNPQHAVKRGFITTPGKQAYSISWYTSPDDWAASQKDLQVIYQGFKPTR
jgi:serine/threonine protein kinase